LFCFGSEIKALLTWPEVPRRLNEDRVADYLAQRHSNKADTFFQDIRRLPAGSAMVIGRTSVRIQTYWEPDPTREIRLSSDAAYAEQFYDLLQEAVRVRLRTAFTPGAHLSGGLDSSSIVALARDLLAADGQDTLHTFTARFEELPSCDEGRYVAAMVEQGGVVSHVVRPGGDNLLEDLDEMLWYQDEPISWPSWVLERALFRTAREAGVRMLLSGHSGDITLSHGDGYFCELARTGRWLPLMRGAADFCELRGLDVSSFVWKEAVRPALSRSIPTPLRRLVWHRKFRGVPYS
ncbi:MAG TPA: asparagine synthase-related protein, partial [Rhodothermales bacterium]|nr:asparagine synthase-related protein [Rhodothermales bacterium]